MRIVFWQNIFSMIDLPYIVGVSKDSRIDEVVVVANKIGEDRIKMGWDSEIPGIERCTLLSNLSNQEIESIISKDSHNSFHMFSGLNAYPHVYYPFRISLKYPVRRGITAERPMTYAYGLDWLKPLWLHRLRFLCKNHKVMKHIEMVFEIGKDTTNYYESLSRKWKVFPFAYCTRDNDILNIKTYKKMSLSVVFVGSLTVRKSVITILKAAKILKNKGYEDRITFSIIGDGPQMSKLNRFVKDNGLNNISFKGNMKNQQVSQFLVNQDVLVLPSIHDGWGAVINEALQAGLYAICSDRCGAKELFVARPHLGSCFKLGDSYGLSLLLEKCLLDISNLRENYPERRRWAKNTISGDIIGKYLVDCICGEDVIAPWMRCDSFQFEITDKSLLSR